MRLLALACAGLLASTGGEEPVRARAPAAVPVDAFHPDHQPGPDGVRPPLPAPAWGGAIRVHTESLPTHLNLALSSSAYARRILEEAHAWLMRHDLASGEFCGELASSVESEDTLWLGERAIVGRVEDGGEGWIVRAAGAEERHPKAGARLERGTVLTFHLRPGVTWHDGHAFDAADVVFSWSVYQNPLVRCDAKRASMRNVVAAEALDARTVRFTSQRQHFHTLIALGDLFLLPRHLYDPTDPDHERADPAFHAARRARDPAWKPGPADVAECVNENPHNRAFVGLGPYRVARFDPGELVLERCAGFFDPGQAGFVDAIRWREERDFQAAFRALLDGRYDFVDALTTDDYLSEAARSERFRERWYTGTHASQSYWYVGWNLRSPKLADARVRMALAHLADLDGLLAAYYRGFARRMSGPFLPESPACDPEVRPVAFDPARAEVLLTEAGWIDRDGDGLRDRDGIALEIELLLQAGNAAGQGFAARFQEELARAGVRLEVRTLDFKTIDERRAAREFEAVALGWALAPESDPEHTWHSRWAAPELRSANHVGLSDPEVDALIEAGQRELDHGARQAIWRRLHARIAQLQPYLFCFAPARKFALARALRGFQEYPLEPNWRLRDLHYPAGTPGTRERPTPR